MSAHVSRSSGLWPKHRGVWLEDILESQTAEADPWRLWWKVPSPDNRLPHTTMLLFASHKEFIIVKGNNFCIVITEQQQMPGKLWCEFCKFLWCKKYWKMPCLLKIVDARVWWCGRTRGHFQPVFWVTVGFIFQVTARSVRFFTLEELNQPQMECTKFFSAHRHGTYTRTDMWVAYLWPTHQKPLKNGL